jgi:hypothetical protein
MVVPAVSVVAVSGVVVRVEVVSNVVGSVVSEVVAFVEVVSILVALQSA